ncbi:MAG TPA: ArsA family ATPase, partial [Caproiciproducens sp.]|nr:ArsA family ATPase [Caproiciproducens sp.]
MRIIIYTGKGGVGKTSVAAATAVKSAERGLKTLVVSTDPAHSLGDSFDRRLSNEPVEIMENLWAQEIDTIHEVEEGWGKVQKYLTDLFTSKAIKDITTEELTVFPGMEDLLSLLRILKYYKEGRFEVIIVDCAPTGETLALLSFP